MNDDLSQYHLDGEFVDWPRRPSIMAACTFYLFAAIGVTLVPWVSYAIRWVWPQVRVSAYQLPLSALCQMFAILLPVALHWSRHPGVDSGLRLKKAPPGLLLIAAPLAILGVLLAKDLGTLWLILIQSLGGRVSQGALQAPQSIWAICYLLFCTALLPAVCEEMLFRGAILGAWERRGTTLALCVSSALFALLHGTVAGLPIQLLLGFVLGYLVINADSLYAAMVYHFVHNAGVLLLAMHQEPMAGNLYEGIGGMAGVLLSALRALVLLGVFVFLLIAFSSDREQSGRPFERPGPVDLEPLGWQEMVLLASCLVTVGLRLMQDLLWVMRVI